MSFNFSSYPNLSSVNSDPLYKYCLILKPSSFVFITFSITKIFLLLPACILILFYGFQKWQQNHTSSSATTMSHYDCFTYHIIIMELFGLFGCFICCIGIYRDYLIIVEVGTALISFTWYGEVFFHLLTCFERYLAVVHPITYLSLRNKRGIRIRNISTICAWLFSSAAMSLVILGNLFLDWCLLILSLILISFFSLSVLHVLIHPGPGEQGAKKERVDQSKQRAFYTIVIVLVELGLRLAWNLVWGVMNESKDSSNCVIITVVFWFSLPSNLVLPLLFLHKTGNYFVVCNKT